MDEDVGREAELQAEREKEWWLRHDRPQAEEWLRQDNLIYGGLIILGIYMVQPFLTATSLDQSAKVCVVAFSLAIPLLAGLVMVNQQEAFRRRATRSCLVRLTKVAAQLLAFTGAVAGFWHITWVAGAGMLAGGIIGVGVHSAGYTRLERDRQPWRQETDTSHDPEP